MSFSKDCVSVGGYDAKIFERKPSEVFQCRICEEILKNPMQCSSGHSFCNSCILSSLELYQSCPVCKISLCVERLKRSVLIQQMIDQFTTFCVSHDSTTSTEVKLQVNSLCWWKGPLYERNYHYFSECEYYVVKCKNVGCEVEIIRKSISEHNEVCLHAPVLCKYCNELTIRDDLQYHEEFCEVRRTKGTTKPLEVVSSSTETKNNLLSCDTSPTNTTSISNSPKSVLSNSSVRAIDIHSKMKALALYWRSIDNMKSKLHDVHVISHFFTSCGAYFDNCSDPDFHRILMTIFVNSKYSIAKLLTQSVKLNYAQKSRVITLNHESILFFTQKFVDLYRKRFVPWIFVASQVHLELAPLHAKLTHKKGVMLTDWHKIREARERIEITIQNSGIVSVNGKYRYNSTTELFEQQLEDESIGGVVCGQQGVAKQQATSTHTIYLENDNSECVEWYLCRDVHKNIAFNNTNDNNKNVNMNMMNCIGSLDKSVNDMNKNVTKNMDMNTDKNMNKNVNMSADPCGVTEVIVLYTQVAGVGDVAPSETTPWVCSVSANFVYRNKAAPTSAMTYL